MKGLRGTTLVAAAVSLAVLGAAAVAVAEDGPRDSQFGVFVMSGLQALNENDTALPDNFVNVPVVADVTYHFSRIVAVEGDFTWMVPVEQEVQMGPGPKQEQLTPHMLAYQANVRANWPQGGWAPYLVAGAGAATFLSDTDSNRVPAVDESQTMFAMNFGAGADIGWTPHFALRFDFRELVAFPANDAAGLSASGEADPIWMERATLGLGYLF